MKLKLLAALPLITLAAHAQLPAVLAKLDEASAKFKNAQADVRYDNYTKVVRDHDIQTGSIFIQRVGTGESMGAVIYKGGSKEPSQIVNYGGGQLRSYTAGTNQEDIFNAGANQAKYQSFLTLGFGGSGKDLANAWTITDQGEEAIGGIKTEKLDLVSKDDGVRKMFRHVTIWIDPARGVSVRQTFFQPGSKPDTDGDYRTTDYSNIRLNGSINMKPYEIPKNSEKIRH